MSHALSLTTSNAGNDAHSISSSCTLQSTRTVPCSIDAAPHEHGENAGAHGLPSISAVKAQGEGEETVPDKVTTAAANGASGTGAAAAPASGCARHSHVSCEEAVPLALANAGLPTLKTQVLFFPSHYIMVDVISYSTGQQQRRV